MYHIYFNNAGLDYDENKKELTIWAGSKNVAIIFTKPFAFRMPNVYSSVYTIYNITKTLAGEVYGHKLFPNFTYDTFRMDKDTCYNSSYDPIAPYEKLIIGNMYTFDENVLQNGEHYFRNPAGTSLVFRFETANSKLVIPEFYFYDEITIKDLTLENKTNLISYTANSIYTGKNLRHSLSINNESEEIIPAFEENKFNYTITPPVGLSKVNILANNKYTTGTSKTLYIKNSGDIEIDNNYNDNNIILYRKNETDFTTNGEGVLKNFVMVEVTEVLNDVYNLEFIIPNTEKISNNIVTGSVIKCPVSKNKPKQLFKVRNVKRNKNNTKIFAQHIALSKLKGNYIKSDYISKTNCITAIDELFSNTIMPLDLKIEGNNFGENKEINIKKGSVLNSLLSNKDSIKNIFGCDFEYDNFTLKVYEKRGKESECTLRDRKNIINVEEDINDNDICTVIIPYSSDGITIPELTVTSPNFFLYGDLYCKEITFQNIKLDEINNTTEKIQEALIKASKDLFENEKIDLPFFTYTADIEEIENKFDCNIDLGDEIMCYYKPLNLELVGRVVSRKYNPITNKNTKLEINFRKKTLNDLFGAKAISETIQSKRDFATKKLVNDLIDDVKNKIDGTGSAIVTNSQNINILNNEKLDYIEKNVDLEYRLIILEINSNI